ncbi:hypothetical protein D9M71_660360 [compost metagenome]
MYRIQSREDIALIKRKVFFIFPFLGECVVMLVVESPCLFSSAVSKLTAVEIPPISEEGAVEKIIIFFMKSSSQGFHELRCF